MVTREFDPARCPGDVTLERLSQAGLYRLLMINRIPL